MKDQFYSACCCCTAKWFSRQKLTECPRCGCDKVQHTRAVPPWTRWAARSTISPEERATDHSKPDAEK